MQDDKPIESDLSDQEIHETAVKVARKVVAMREPAMQGYTRDLTTLANFLSILTRVLSKYPPLRVGQLLYVALIEARQSTALTHDEQDAAIGHLLFNIFDEELIEALEAFDADRTKAKKSD